MRFVLENFFVKDHSLAGNMDMLTLTQVLAGTSNAVVENSHVTVPKLVPKKKSTRKSNEAELEGYRQYQAL